MGTAEQLDCSVVDDGDRGKGSGAHRAAVLRHRKARMLLRQVDGQLRHGAPCRRAMEALQRIHGKMPRGTLDEWNAYFKVLTGIQKRRELAYEDCEAERLGAKP